MARRSSGEWEAIVAEAMRHARDLFLLEESPLADEEAIRAHARARYPGRILGVGMAIRDHLRSAAAVIARDCGDEAFGRFCTAYAGGAQIAEIARELGMSRCHLSREWRPRAIRLITGQLRADLQVASRVAA